MAHEDVEKNCDALIKKMINDTAGTRDFAVTYTVWYPLSQFVLSDTGCGQKSARVHIAIGTAVYELYGSYRRLALKVAETLERVFAPFIESGKAGLSCERDGSGISVRFDVK